jgi:hypothetical protein
VRRTLGRLLVAIMVTTLLLGGGTAFASQPADLGNVADSDRGESAVGIAETETGAPANVGPHCHFVIPAEDKSPFGDIRTGAAHQAHVQTGLPTGIFAATAC